ncbi:MAG: hypothetical protein EON58_11410 [Alphaproteobacteria bacterium]|nr:MAG: hypothetical protein EON58_11410 [Alphaproteobacteria bacterium]
MHPTSIQTTSLLLGAAFAGLAGVAPEAKAATIVTETVDFGDYSFEATDLTTTWTNFAADGGIAGNVTVASGDYGDFVVVSAPANTQVTIPVSFTSSVEDPYAGFQVITGNTLLTYADFSTVTPNVTQYGSLTFTVPASGQVTIGLFQESGMGSVLDYTIGQTVPEAGSSVLGLAGMAAAALRRRRSKES